MKLTPFEMERWQSTYEHRVRFNLSESGVNPLSLDELLELSGHDLRSLGDLHLGYGQSNGSDQLRQLIAAMYPGAQVDNVLVTVGGAEANFATFWQLMEPGEKAAVMLPNYMQVPGLLANFRAEALPFHLREETGWQPDLEELRAALDRGARFVLVTNPNNPTGRSLAPEARDRIVELAALHGAWILADEVYQGAEVTGVETLSFWGTYDRVLVTNSLSKAYGLPGLRIGWVVGPEDVVAELWSRTDYTTITPASLSDRLACLALEPSTRARILKRTRGIIRNNLGTLRASIDRESTARRGASGAARSRDGQERSGTCRECSRVCRCAGRFVSGIPEGHDYAAHSDHDGRLGAARRRSASLPPCTNGARRHTTGCVVRNCVGIGRAAGMGTGAHHPE